MHVKRSVPLALCLLAVICAPAKAVVLRNLDFQSPGLLKPDGSPFQWENYVPDKSDTDKNGTSGITLGSPGVLPYPYTQAARFQPELQTGRPRSMAKLAKHSLPDGGVALSGPLDAAEGLDRYYMWYSYFPPDFDIPADAPKNAPTVFHAWHNDEASGKCNPNSQMHVKRLGPGDDGLRILIRVQGGRYSSSQPTTFTAEGGNSTTCFTETNKEIDLGPVVRGRWILWRLHVRWSSNPALGTTELRRDDQAFTIPGANLYRTDAGAIESGFMEHGIYIPVEATPAGRSRSIWSVGMRIGTSEADITPLADPRSAAQASCRQVSAQVHRLRVGGGKLVVKIDARSTSDAPAHVRLIGTRAKLRRASITVDGKRIAFRKRHAAVPAAALDRQGFHNFRIRITPRHGRTRSFSLKVRSRPCK